MIVLSIILILLTFLQATLWPLQLTLLVIILRSLIREDRANLYLAFGLGLLTSFLNRYPLGLESALYLLLVFLIYLLRKTNISNQLLIIFPLSAVLLIIDHFAALLQSKLPLSLDINALIIQMILVLPVYLLVRFWEERFTPVRDIKLKIRS